MTIMKRLLLILALCWPAPAALAQPQAQAQLNNPEALVRIAERLRASGDTRSALNFYQRAMELEPDNIAALRGTALLLTQSGAATASELYWRRLLAQIPEDAEARLGLAEAANARNQPAEALDLLAQLKPAEARSAKALAQRGLALDLSGDTQAAQMAYGEALERAGPGAPDLRVRLALSFALSKDYRTANRLLQPMVNQPGVSDKVRRALGLAYALAGDAEAGARIATMDQNDPAEASKGLLRIYRQLPSLTIQQQAAAVHLGIIDLPEPPEAAAAPPAAPVPVVAAAMQPAPVARGGSWVQLGAFSNVAQLRQHWDMVRRKAGDLVEQTSPGIARLSGYERLLLGPLTGADAAALAVKLKARGIDAFIRAESLTPTPLD